MRSHFTVPALQAQPWVLELGGAVVQSRSWSLVDLQRRPSRTQTVVLECAGHRRSEFQPATSGLQWGVGAISEARWTGVPLAELLAEASPTSRGGEVLFEGADHGLHRSSSDELPFARSITLEHALAGDVLIAWEMNGQPDPAEARRAAQSHRPGQLRSHIRQVASTHRSPQEPVHGALPSPGLPAGRRTAPRATCQLTDPQARGAQPDHCSGGRAVRGRLGWPRRHRRSRVPPRRYTVAGSHHPAQSAALVSDPLVRFPRVIAGRARSSRFGHAIAAKTRNPNGPGGTRSDTQTTASTASPSERTTARLSAGEAEAIVRGRGFL